MNILIQGGGAESARHWPSALGWGRTLFVPPAIRNSHRLMPNWRQTRVPSCRLTYRRCQHPRGGGNDQRRRARLDRVICTSGMLKVESVGKTVAELDAKALFTVCVNALGQVLLARELWPAGDMRCAMPPFRRVSAQFQTIISADGTPIRPARQR